MKHSTELGSQLLPQGAVLARAQNPHWPASSPSPAWRTVGGRSCRAPLAGRGGGWGHSGPALGGAGAGGRILKFLSQQGSTNICGTQYHFLQPGLQCFNEVITAVLLRGFPFSLFSHSFPYLLLVLYRDIMSIYKEPPPGMFVVPDTVDMTKIHALITGPFDTPYEGGFFLFVFRCPPDYPIHPPRVKLMTTGNNTVRFNPNFYRNGKVCLSILGTWTGPAWSPAQSISSVLISIQSLMTENPYHNEPGFEQERHPGDSKNYNECIRHETIRVAVCDMMEGKCPCPEPLRGVMEKSFLEYYDFYEVACKDRLHLQGQTMQDPFGEKRGHFDYQSLLMRLGLIRQKVLERLHNENAEMDSDSSSSGTETDLHGSLRV
uniref:Ubiquitin-conjugating enzyme E2 Z n=2 Tax=Boreoeutheria TaxID=1437010 RepID=A0A8C9UQA6_SPEDA